jgi:hypothetical protein
MLNFSLVEKKFKKSHEIQLIKSRSAEDIAIVGRT